MRKDYAELLQRHRASAAIQSHVKRKIAKRQYKATVDASVVIQSGKKGLKNLGTPFFWKSEFSRIAETFLLQLFVATW